MRVIKAMFVVITTFVMLGLISNVNADELQVEAGKDQILCISSHTFLDGEISYNGVPISSGVTSNWEHVISSGSSGGQVFFVNPSDPKTGVFFSEDGIYRLRLTAHFFGMSASDDVIIEVNTSSCAAPNLPPDVDAGLDQVLCSTSVAILDGTVTDDGYPNPPGELRFQWLNISSGTSTGTVVFTDPTSEDTEVFFAMPGTYTLLLSAYDGEFRSQDEVIVFVDVSTICPPQDPPIDVNAGRDRKTKLNQVLSLLGKISQNGNPLPPTGLIINWVQLNGPGSVKFSNPNALETHAQFTNIGEYELRLRVTENGREFYDDVQVKVRPNKITILEAQSSNRFNPNKDQGTIAVDIQGPFSVTIYDRNNRTVKSMTFAGAEHDARLIQWDGRDDRGRKLPSGVYVGKIKHLSTGEIKTIHFISVR